MNILVTGIGGFVGSTLCNELLKFKNINIIGIDDSSYGDLSNINNFKKKIKIINKDICYLKLSDLKKYGKISIIIHLAAQAGVRYSITNPEAYVDSNLIGFAKQFPLIVQSASKT